MTPAARRGDLNSVANTDEFLTSWGLLAKNVSDTASHNGQQMTAPKVTFFMLVTNRDVSIADYAVKSYQKIYDEFKEELPFVLYIYCNCLKEDIKQKYMPKWAQYNYVQLFDNYAKTKTMNLRAGETITSPEGVDRLRDGWCENYDELWTSELRKFQTDYVATVDADFEILSPYFIGDMMDALESDPQLIGISSDYSAGGSQWDSYSGKVLNLAERWNTWFCIYKREAFNCKTSHFYYCEEKANGEILYFDSSAYFQHRLITDFGYRFSVVDSKCRDNFIHYGAFSKNKSVTEKNVCLYRQAAILRQNGLKIPLLNRTPELFNKFVNRGAGMFIGTFFNEAERGRWDFSKD